MSNPRDKEIEELRKLIRNIFLYSEKEWKQIEKNEETKYIRKKEEIFSFASDLFMACNDNILEEAIKNVKKFESLKRMRIVLPPLKDDTDFLPLLSFKWVFDKTNEESKFVLDLVKNKSHILSLRFERPQATGGDHDYLHVQINNRFDYHTEEYMLKWLPDHNPHILLRTNDFPNSPIVLLLYLIGSLYGFRGFAENVLSGLHQKYANEMKSFLPN